MTKAQREKAERLMLKQILDSKPEYKKIMDALIDQPDKEIKDVIQPVIEVELKKARMVGTQIGWQAALLRAYEMIKDCKTLDEAKDLLRGSADSIRKSFGMSSFFDEYGNIIADEEE